MKRYFISIFIFSVVFCSLKLKAQDNGFVNYSNIDELILRKKVLENPDLKQLYIDFEKQVQIQINRIKNQKTDTLIDSMRIIPVVFHIIHKGGAENISNDQVRDAVRLINIDYNKQNSDTSNTYSIFKPLAANCRIQFRLAKVDPQGNCTDGIEHIYDPETNYAYFAIMSRYAWSPSRYMNVFSVASIYPSGMSLPDGAFIGGMSPFPPSNPLTQSLTGGDTLADGVLIRHDCIGSIGTATNMGGMPINSLNRSFTHETGHYLNLYHTFNSILGMGCYEIAGYSGDEVSDTPPVSAATQNTGISCFVPGSRNTCTNDVPDLPDMIENYMDYQWGYCSNIFTLGQLNRIDATMNSDRRYLCSLENLIATGVLDTSQTICAPKADFSSDKKMICSGGTINFHDISYRGPVDSLIWTFEGGNPNVSNSRYPIVTYATPGLFKVTLRVLNNGGEDSLVRTDYIRVIEPALTSDAPVVEGFESGFNQGWFTNNDGGNSWEVTDSGSFSGTKSMVIRNYANNPSGSYDEIITGGYNLTTLPSGSMANLKFKLSYAGRLVPGNIIMPADTAYDALRVYSSFNCGGTWQRIYIKSGKVLTTTTPVQTSYKPLSPSAWRTENININSLRLQTNVRFKFEFVSNGGNNLYIDDINITLANDGVEDNSGTAFNLSVFPNPVLSETNISFTLLQTSNVEIVISDLLGRKINSLSYASCEEGNRVITLAKTQFGKPGVYFIRISIDDKTMVKKVIVE